MNSLEAVTRGIEVQGTIGFEIFQSVDPVYHDSLYSFARIIYNYLKMSSINEKP